MAMVTTPTEQHSPVHQFDALVNIILTLASYEATIHVSCSVVAS